MTRFKVKLPNTARAIRSGKPLVIVAIGSSSTVGVGASDPAHTYPAVLAEELRHRWPQLAVTVINKGVGGELASQMLARFERDVLPYRPQLVIWQTGSNEALRREDIEGYAGTIREGISRLKVIKADIVLMDPQFAPAYARAAHAPAHCGLYQCGGPRHERGRVPAICSDAAPDIERPVQDGGHHFERRPAHERREL